MRWITLDVEPEPVTPLPGLVYSTAPKTSVASDGYRYFIKGPDPAIVIAEALGYTLAELIGLRVPTAGRVRPRKGPRPHRTRDPGPDDASRRRACFHRGPPRAPRRIRLPARDCG